MTSLRRRFIEDMQIRNLAVMSAAGCDWAIVSDQLRLDRQSSAAVMEGEDSKPARFGVS